MSVFGSASSSAGRKVLEAACRGMSSPTTTPGPLVGGEGGRGGGVARPRRGDGQDELAGRPGVEVARADSGGVATSSRK